MPRYFFFFFYKLRIIVGMYLFFNDLCNIGSFAGHIYETADLYWIKFCADTFTIFILKAKWITRVFSNRIIFNSGSQIFLSLYFLLLSDALEMRGELRDSLEIKLHSRNHAIF